IFQGELVEQRRLRFLLRSHHRQSLHLGRIESATYASFKPKFFNEIRPHFQKRIIHIDACTLRRSV
ncbi:MAG: hypothetical protein AAGF94_12985, partial [Pseudomonadota bacterium]